MIAAALSLASEPAARQEEPAAVTPAAKAARGPTTSRLTIIKDRVRRHSLFKPAYVHPGAGGHKSDALQLSQIGTLFGRKGNHVLLGLLTETDTGAILLSDEDGSIPLDLSRAHTTGGFFTPSSVVLVEGSVNDAGVFEVEALGHPPFERGAHHDHRADQEGPVDGGMLLVFSEVHLDHAETLVKLEVVLRGYEIAGKQLMGDGASAKPFADTFTFVFCGNFSSTPYSPEVPRSKVKLLFRRFAELLGRFPLLKEHARFIFVAGPSDASLGPAATLEHPPLSEVLCADLRAVLTHCHFAGNPARFTLGSQQVVLYREEVMARLKRGALVPPSEEGDTSLSEHLVDSILQQAHLCPLPSAVATSYEPSAFILDRPPDVLIIAERRAQFTTDHAGTTAFNPGSFSSSGRWMVYHAHMRKAESSSI